jgi:acyl carrier protein
VFYDAFAEYRNARGQHTVSMALPVVIDVGYVADRDLSSMLKSTLGATLTMADIRTMFKGAILGKANPFQKNGRGITFKLYLGGEATDDVSWKYFHPVHIRSRLNNESNRKEIKGAGQGGAAQTGSWTKAADPVAGLIEAIITKVSNMTMIERDDVEPDIPLAAYGLDSLVSVELRNWIRRETGVELALTSITHAANLRALVAQILAQRASTS